VSKIQFNIVHENPIRLNLSRKMPKMNLFKMFVSKREGIQAIPNHFHVSKE